jgi:hypothetical protein
VPAEYALLASWMILFANNLGAERWLSAAFCLANALMLAYAIHSFIGLRESSEDVRPAFRRRRRSAAQAVSASAT